MESLEKPINKNNVTPKEGPAGIFRRTLAYNNDAMLCHFELKKGSKIPLHNHKHAQIGYVIKGKVKFFTEQGEFLAEEGDSYVFNSFEKHGADVVEDSEIIEVFVPCRDEYKP